MHNTEQEIISSYIDLHSKTWQSIEPSKITICAKLLSGIRSSNKTLWLAGNGGSMSTASHAANDFTKTLDETGLNNIRAICLNDLVATHSAWSNDASYESALRNLAAGIVQEGDIVMVFTGSGNSKNVIELIEYAKSRRVKTIAFTGFDGGAIASKVDFHLNVPVADMQVTEDLHLSLVHLLVLILRNN